MFVHSFCFYIVTVPTSYDFLIQNTITGTKPSVLQVVTFSLLSLCVLHYLSLWATTKGYT